MKKSIFLVAVSAMGIVACQKEKPVASNPASGSGQGFAQFSTRSTPVVSLDENGVGEWHNYYMDQIYAQVEADITTAGGYENYTRAGARQSGITLIESIIQGNNATYHQGHAIEILDVFMDDDALADNVEELEAIVTGSSIPNSVKNTYIAFWAACDTVTTTSGATAVANWMKTEANTKLTGNHKLIAIGSADVFEASYAYWTANIDDWNDLLTDGAGGSNSNSTKMSVAGADGKGFTVGAYYGSMGGTVTVPGIATLGGWIGGGLGGALLGSFGALVSNAWDYFFG